ncbi:MAG: tetratricopeptide repeat protein, partial [Pseudomonadota bacterium]
VPDGGVEDGASIPLGTLDLGVAEEGTVSALRRIFRETGSTGAMLAVVPKVLEEDDTLHVARTLLALGEVSDGQLEAAQTNLSRIEEAELEIPEVDMLRAMLARESGDIAAARTNIARALAADPEHAYAFHIRATLALAEGDTGAALQDFEAATRFSPEGALYWSNLGVILTQFGAVEAAADALNRAVTIEPGSCPTLVGLSILRRQEGKAAAAVGRLNECLDADPNNTAAAELLVSTQIQMGDITGARESFGRVRRLLPDDALWDAALSLREGQFARVSEGLEISPSRDAAQGLILAGASALAQGNLDQARTQLSAALEADPAAVTAQVGLFALDLAQGSTPQFDTASGGVDPQIDAFYRALSRTDGRLPDIEAAENILPGMTFDGLRAQDTDRALTPDHVQALAKAMFLLLLDAPHGAQSVLAELEYDLPYPALSGYLQAFAAAKSGQTDMATQTALLEQVTAAAPGFFAAQVMYAETLLQQNRPGTALNAYKAAAQTRETGPVLLRIGLLGEATGDDATAEDGYRRFAALEPNSHIA